MPTTACSKSVWFETGTEYGQVSGTGGQSLNHTTTSRAYWTPVGPIALLAEFREARNLQPGSLARHASIFVHPTGSYWYTSRFVLSDFKNFSGWATDSNFLAGLLSGTGSASCVLSAMAIPTKTVAILKHQRLQTVSSLGCLVSSRGLGDTGFCPFAEPGLSLIPTKPLALLVCVGIGRSLRGTPSPGPRPSEHTCSQCDMQDPQALRTFKLVFFL